MTATNLADVNNHINTYHAPIETKLLQESGLLYSLTTKKYEGEIKQAGDTVRVSQVNPLTGSRTNAQTQTHFETEKLTTTYVDIKADQRFVAAVEIPDVVDIQTYINNNDILRAELRRAVGKQINNYLLSKVAPSTATPDHEQTTTDMTSTNLATYRKLAGQALWPVEDAWFGLVDPSYWSDLIDDAVINSADKGGVDAPAIGGRIALPRMGFNLFEDNSLSEDYGLFFHPSFLIFCIQQQLTYEVSRLHSNKQFGYVISAHIIGGASLGLNGNVKHIRVQAS